MSQDSWYLRDVGTIDRWEVIRRGQDKSIAQALEEGWEPFSVTFRETYPDIIFLDAWLRQEPIRLNNTELVVINSLQHRISYTIHALIPIFVQWFSLYRKSKRY